MQLSVSDILSAHIISLAVSGDLTHRYRKIFLLHYLDILLVEWQCLSPEIKSADLPAPPEASYLTSWKSLRVTSCI